MYPPNYTKRGVGIGALVGIGLCGCALSAGIISTPILVPTGLAIVAGPIIISGLNSLAIVAGSMVAGAIIGNLASPSSSPEIKSPSRGRIVPGNSPSNNDNYTRNWHGTEKPYHRYFSSCCDWRQ